jgi:hypothetical protein
LGHGIIVGDWSHRRGDAGGARSLAAEVQTARPATAWTWEPPRGARIDQVRIAGPHVLVATLEAPDPNAPGWEHAVVYALDAASGRVLAGRTLADPAPVAAMVVEAGVVHLIATRADEPIYWYALNVPELRPLHRRLVMLEGDSRRLDVLDAWASSDGGLWLETDDAQRGVGAYAFVEEQGESASSVPGPEAPGYAAVEAAAPRDACCVGRSLFAPVDGAWDAQSALPPSLIKLDSEQVRSLESPRGPPAGAWARTALEGPHSQAHALAAESVVCALAMAGDPEREGHALVQAMAMDRVTGTVRWQSDVTRVGVAAVGVGARLARRANGEIFMQRVDGNGVPCSDLFAGCDGGALDTLSLGTRRKFLLDATLGDTLLAHYDKGDGTVVVGAFAIARDGGIFGRRARMLYSVETPAVGGPSTVYAGADRILVRGEARLIALRV